MDVGAAPVSAPYRRGPEQKAKPAAAAAAQTGASTPTQFHIKFNILAENKRYSTNDFFLKE